MDTKEVEYIIEKTINKLRNSGMIKEGCKPVTQRTEELLRYYPKLKLSESLNSKDSLKKVENALNTIRDDPYYKIIEMYYFTRMSREEIADHFNTNEKTITRNRQRLLKDLTVVLFPDDVVKELLEPEE